MTALQTPPARTAPPPTRLRPTAWVLATCAVVVQMSFPFTDGGNLALTTASVLLLSAAAVSDVAGRLGLRAALALLVVAGGGGLLAETVGVHTGLPFGGYDYTGSLGVELLGVPVLVPLAWVMMAWPALVVARRLTARRGRVATALVGAWALTAWDVFLDPQMVDQGYWRWDDPHPALPGVEGIPLSNFAGWLLVSLLLVAVLDRVLADPRRPGPAGGAPADGLPVAVYLWTYGSSVLAHAAFFGRPPVALVGAVLMGLVAWPLVASLRSTRARARARARSGEGG